MEKILEAIKNVKAAKTVELAEQKIDLGFYEETEKEWKKGEAAQNVGYKQIGQAEMNFKKSLSFLENGVKGANYLARQAKEIGAKELEKRAKLLEAKIKGSLSDSKKVINSLKKI